MNNYLSSISIVLAVSCSSLWAGAPVRAVQPAVFHGLRPDDPDGKCGLPNPERGFRHEAYIGLQPGRDFWGEGAWLRGRVPAGFSDDRLLINARRYRCQGITLAQAYCYLDRFIDRPISEEKLAWLQRSLDRCREAGLKVLLRFAYETNMQRNAGPTAERILSHIDQLAPLLRANRDVIYVLQAGFVGAWGEWHNSTHQIEKDHSKLAAIVARELKVLPADRMIQLRVLPKYKRWVLRDPILNALVPVDRGNAFSGIPAARLGFANDGFCANKTDGGTWPEPPRFANPGNPEFDAVTGESPFLAVDGELFWSDQGGQIDGLLAAERLRLHHYTSLSITHSYSGYEGKPYTIDGWMKTPITADELHRRKLPVADGYFGHPDGPPVERTVFEYIRDHLGYRIELQRAAFAAKVAGGTALETRIELVNRGFATVINPRKVYLVLIDTNGSLVRQEATDADPRTWQPFRPGDAEFAPLTHRVQGRMPTAGLAPGSYMLGLWLPDASSRIGSDSRFAIRVANRDVPWWATASGDYGVNVLGRVEIAK